MTDKRVTIKDVAERLKKIEAKIPQGYPIATTDNQEGLMAMMERVRDLLVDIEGKVKSSSDVAVLAPRITSLEGAVDLLGSEIETFGNLDADAINLLGKVERVVLSFEHNVEGRLGKLEKVIDAQEDVRKKCKIEDILESAFGTIREQLEGVKKTSELYAESLEGLGRILSKRIDAVGSKVDSLAKDKGVEIPETDLSPIVNEVKNLETLVGGLLKAASVKVKPPEVPTAQEIASLIKVEVPEPDISGLVEPIRDVGVRLDTLRKAVHDKSAVKVPTAREIAKLVKVEVPEPDVSYLAGLIRDIEVKFDILRKTVSSKPAVKVPSAEEIADAVEERRKIAVAPRLKEHKIGNFRQGEDKLFAVGFDSPIDDLRNAELVFLDENGKRSHVFAGVKDEEEMSFVFSLGSESTKAMAPKPYMYEVIVEGKAGTWVVTSGKINVLMSSINQKEG